MLVSVKKYEIKKYWHDWSELKITDQNTGKITIYGNSTFRRTNFKKFCRIDVRKWTWIFQNDISKIGHFTEQSIKKSWSLKYRTAYKRRTWSRDLSEFTRNIVSSISTHWPRFKSFWWVELKSAFYKGQTRVRILQDFSKIWSVLY